MVSTYTAPVIAPGYFTINTVFFQSTTLPDGEHTLEITFTNATRPNRYWLDYIQYTASITPSESSSSSLSSTDLPSPALEPSSSTVSQSEVASPSGAASSSSRTQVGPIVGGTLGGIAIIVIAALLLLIYLRLRRRDSKKVSSPESRPIGTFCEVIACAPSVTQSLLEPFSSWRQDTRTPYSGTHIAMPSTSALSGSHDAPVSSTLPPIPGAGPPVPRTGQSAGSSSAPHKGHDLRTGPNTRATNGTSTVPLASTASASLDAAVRHHEDSGIRIPPTVVDVPPAYTQA